MHQILREHEIRSHLFFLLDLSKKKKTICFNILIPVLWFSFSHYINSSQKLPLCSRYVQEMPILNSSLTIYIEVHQPWRKTGGKNWQKTKGLLKIKLPKINHSKSREIEQYIFDFGAQRALVFAKGFFEIIMIFPFHFHVLLLQKERTSSKPSYSVLSLKRMRWVIKI